MSKKKLVGHINVKPYHFFASSFANWTSDDNLLHCILRQKKADSATGLKVRGCNVWKVPLHRTANYHIENYQPVVEGLEFVDHVEYTRSHKK